jgi:hypothetical protein
MNLNASSHPGAPIRNGCWCNFSIDKHCRVLYKTNRLINHVVKHDAE